MPRDYWGEAKIKFPLPSYPKEDAFEDSAKYEVAVDRFGMDCQQVLAEHSTWVNHETIADLACESEAACARVADNKKHCEAEEEKKHQEMGEHPRKQGQVDTAGSTLAECQGTSETGNVSRPSAHGTPTDLRNGHSRGWIPAECLEQKMRRKLSSHFTQVLLYITDG